MLNVLSVPKFDVSLPVLNITDFSIMLCLGLSGHHTSYSVFGLKGLLKGLVIVDLSMIKHCFDMV